MNTTTKSASDKDSSTGSKSPASKEVFTVAVEGLTSPIIATKWPMSPAKCTNHKKKESTENPKAQKGAKTTMKQSAKIKEVKSLPEALTGSRVTMSMDCTVIDFVIGVVSLGMLMLVLVHNTKENIVALSQMPEDLPPLPVSVDIPRAKTGRCTMVQKNLQVALKDGELVNCSGADSKQGSDEEGSQPT